MAAAAASVYLQASAQSPKSPVGVNGPLSIKGNQLVNQNGVPPQLRGISFSWSIWQGQKYYNTEVLDWLVKDFKVSLVRLAMAVQPAGGYLEKPEEQQQRITTIADKAIKDSIYVLIDWHDHHSNEHVEQAKKFFAAMAQRYNGIPNVIYEIWNEPEKISWDTVKNYALQIIPVIRQYDANNVIVVGSPHWDQDVDVAAKSPITGFNNIAYSFHFYATEPSHQEKLRARADAAIQMGLPLMVTEWGVGEANGNGEFNRDKTKTWMQWMIDHKLSWANWNITDKQETTALLEPGAPVSGGWKKSELTPAGQYIRKQLRKQNKEY